MKKIISLFVVLFIGSAVYVSAQELPLVLPAVLSDHAVLQENTEVKLWGKGPGGLALKVVCSWMPGDTLKTRITPECDWEINVHTPSSSGGDSIIFMCGSQKLKIRDIIFGEVWICSGQSNMEFNAGWGLSDAGSAFEDCSNNEIRFFEVKKSYDRFPLSDCSGEWVVCDKKSAFHFSSTGYFFGRKLNKILKSPIGLIGSYWEGSCIQSWIPANILYGDSDLRTAAVNKESYKCAPEGGGVLYNAMINPLTSYRIAGSIWYQGEANVSRNPHDYAKLFKAMIRGWRYAFSEDFPFYFVQIAPWNGYKGIDGAYLREQQADALSLPRTSMVPVSDLTEDVSNLHPGRKRELGERLADMALSKKYGLKTISSFSPSICGFIIKGNSAYVSVKTCGKLKCSGRKIKNFQIAGADKIFYSADAVILSDGVIKVSSAEVSNPVSVRYCFTNDALPDLFDVNGLPLIPFRTDNW
ncbi:MAG: sialate O-acetylesterase [Bacteroidales bacterium]|nr:sialate O-acetylesterase [Bacteroidales bacterium]